MKKEEFEKRHGKVPDNVTYIDLDEQETVEPVTAGWTDTQIRTKSITEFDQMIASAEMSIEQLNKTVEGERQRLHDLQAIKNRRMQLGA